MAAKSPIGIGPASSRTNLWATASEIATRTCPISQADHPAVSAIGQLSDENSEPAASFDVCSIDELVAISAAMFGMLIAMPTAAFGMVKEWFATLA
jgi:hypothetical protein